LCFFVFFVFFVFFIFFYFFYFLFFFILILHLNKYILNTNQQFFFLFFRKHIQKMETAPWKQMDATTWKKLLDCMNNEIQSPTVRELAQTVVHTIASENPLFTLSIPPKGANEYHTLTFTLQQSMKLLEFTNSLSENDIMKATVCVPSTDPSKVILTILIRDNPSMKRTPIEWPDLPIEAIQRKKLVFMSEIDHQTFQIIIKYAINLSQNQNRVVFNVHNFPEKNMFTVSCVGVTTMDLEYLYCLIDDIGSKALVDVQFFGADAASSTLSSLDITLTHSTSASAVNDIDEIDNDDDNNDDNNIHSHPVHHHHHGNNNNNNNGSERHRKRTSALSSTQVTGNGVSKKQKPRSGFIDKIKALFQ